MTYSKNRSVYYAIMNHTLIFATSKRIQSNNNGRTSASKSFSMERANIKKGIERWTQWKIKRITINRRYCHRITLTPVSSSSTMIIQDINCLTKSSYKILLWWTSLITTNKINYTEMQSITKKLCMVLSTFQPVKNLTKEWSTLNSI